MPVRFQGIHTEKNSEGMKIFQFQGVKNSMLTELRLPILPGVIKENISKRTALF